MRLRTAGPGVARELMPSFWRTVDIGSNTLDWPLEAQRGLDDGREFEVEVEVEFGGKERPVLTLRSFTCRRDLCPHRKLFLGQGPDSSTNDVNTDPDSGAIAVRYGSVE